MRILNFWSTLFVKFRISKCMIYYFSFVRNKCFDIFFSSQNKISQHNLTFLSTCWKYIMIHWTSTTKRKGSIAARCQQIELCNNQWIINANVWKKEEIINQEKTVEKKKQRCNVINKKLRHLLVKCSDVFILKFEI